MNIFKLLNNYQDAFIDEIILYEPNIDWGREFMSDTVKIHFKAFQFTITTNKNGLKRDMIDASCLSRCNLTIRQGSSKFTIPANAFNAINISIEKEKEPIFRLGYTSPVEYQTRMRSISIEIECSRPFANELNAQNEVYLSNRFAINATDLSVYTRDGEGLGNIRLNNPIRVNQQDRIRTTPIRQSTLPTTINGEFVLSQDGSRLFRGQYYPYGEDSNLSFVSEIRSDFTIADAPVSRGE